MKIETSGLIRPEEMDGEIYEVISRLAGRFLPTSDGWGLGEIVGAWKLQRGNEDPHIRLLLAVPNSNNPAQLKNEDSRIYLSSK
jgi:hypothetical protein